MKSITFAVTALVSLLSFSSMAATVDGSITGSEYTWNTKGVEGSSKWTTFNRSNDYREFNDASGGDRWDINYLGTSVENGQFQFGAVGGHILSGRETGNNIYLSDFAIDVTGNGSNPTTDSSDFDYAIRLLSVNSHTGTAEFALLTGGTWESADIYSNAYAPKHKTETYKMNNATTLTTFAGAWNYNGGDDNVLEGAFDLSFLSAFDASVGGVIGTYLTMSCVNDEALVYADVAPVPVPAAIWLLTPALMGFVGLRRRLKKA
jgi:hypothetical protein